MKIKMKCRDCKHEWNLDKDSLVDCDLTVSNNPPQTTNTLEISARCPKCNALVYDSIELRDLILWLIQ